MEAEIKIVIPVGGEFQTNLGTIKAVEENALDCSKCALKKCDKLCDVLACIADERQDKKNVIFDLV